MRKLASIKTVSGIVPIEGRDRIVLALIDGWSVIVKKDEFEIGDKCVYIEIDSVLPEKPEFEFLRCLQEFQHQKFLEEKMDRKYLL